MSKFNLFRSGFWVVVAFAFCFDFQTADMNTIAVFMCLGLSDIALLHALTEKK